MSYYVTITRNPSPYWYSGPFISEEEWRAVALGEPGIRPPIDSEEGEQGDLIWTGHPEYPVCLNWFDGQIDARSPDQLTLAMMSRLAAKLKANLIGEDGQRFDSAGKPLGVVELPEDPNPPRLPRRVRPFWQAIVETWTDFWWPRRTWQEDGNRPRYRLARWR